MKLPTIAVGLVVCAAVALVAQEGQDRATIQLRNGTKVEGRIEALGSGVLFLRVSLADQRKYPVADVALIDRKGGASGLPETELSTARGPEHLLLLTGGGSHRGSLVGIRGGEGSGQDNQPRTYVFRTADGQEHQYGQSEVARIYLGSYPFGTAPQAPNASNSATGPAAGVMSPGAIRVPAAGGWVSTFVKVKKGDRVSFASTGQVQLSDNPEDRATATGNTRFARNAPLPAVAAGGLIGRIGPLGTPFGVGDQQFVPMPADGVLYLAVNDDERTDNAGEFVVLVTPARRR
jgi:hypothetical protein